LRVLLLRRGAFRHTGACTAASAATPAASRDLPLALRLQKLRTLAALRSALGTGRARRLCPRRALLAWRTLLLLLLRTFAVALPLLLAIAPLRTLGARAALFLRPRLPGALLVFADLLLHETTRLLVEFRAQFVVAAIRAALPSLGIGPFTTGAED
jgi:hypothetical protein